MKQLPDFDLSIVMPFYKRLDEFKRVFPSKAKYYERNGIEVVIVADEPTEQEGILDYIRTYPFINWKVVVNLQNNSWRNPARALNVGIRQATKQYVLIMEPELEFYTDVIYELREKLDFYPEYYAVGQVLFMDIREEIDERTLDKHSYELLPYGSIMAKKEYFERIGGYSEYYTKWDGEDDNLRRRLELIGVRQLFFPETILIHRDDLPLRTVSGNEQQGWISRKLLSEIFLPAERNVNKSNWGIDFETVIYDWTEHPYAKWQCREYLSTFKQFYISSDDIFEKTYSLIALIPTYNEAEYITDCLRSIEKYCDGIILLDDDSNDDTFQIAESKKMLVKAKKNRIEFDDRNNRNILLNIASFFKSNWLIFVDADELFSNKYFDLNNIIELPIDVIGIRLVNLWDNNDSYRVDLEDTNPFSKKGIWVRWRMFRNKGRMQIISCRKIHFPSVPYKSRLYVSKTLLLHFGYIDKIKRKSKFYFYQKEDSQKILNYNYMLENNYILDLVENIRL